jgi:hypothetical protein
MDIISLILLILNIIAALVMLVLVPYKMYFPQSEKKDKFACYEIWRPNIPDDGCKKQCQACKEQEQKP